MCCKKKKIGKLHDNQRIKLDWNPLLGLWWEILFNLVIIWNLQVESPIWTLKINNNNFALLHIKTKYFITTKKIFIESIKIES